MSQNVLKFRDVKVLADKKCLLNNIHGEVRSGELLAIMGPSGCGKTTFLNFLSFRLEALGSSKYYGSVHYNDELYTKKMRYRIAYVTQHDVLFENLSLYETLLFYANLRLPKKYSKAEKLLIVYNVMEAMKLEKCANTIIGGAMLRGLSGGEKKRACIACELITNPDMIFLDEPTSGLDSNMALNVVKILDEYCTKNNKIVITSIHQPNSLIFYTFNNLLLLYSGEIAYHGKIENVCTFFEDCGFACPKNWNAADYIVDVICNNENDAFKVISYFKKNDKNEAQEIISNKINEVSSTILDEKPSSKTGQKKFRKSKWPAGAFIQFMVLTRRAFMISVDSSINLLSLLEIIITSFLVGIVWFQISWTESDLKNILGYIYYVNMLILTKPVFDNVFLFTAEKYVVSKERMASMYRLSIYYVSKVIGDLPSYLLRATLISIVTYWMAGLRKSPIFLLFIVILYMGTFSGQVIGIFLGSFGLSMSETLVLAVLVFISISMFGGFFTTKLPSWINWARYLSPIYQMSALQVYAQFYHNSVLCSDLSSFASCKPGLKVPLEDILNILQIDIPIYSFAILMCGTIIILHILSYSIFKYTLTRPPMSLGNIQALSIKQLMTKIYVQRDLVKEAST